MHLLHKLNIYVFVLERKIRSQRGLSKHEWINYNLFYISMRGKHFTITIVIKSKKWKLSLKDFLIKSLLSFF